MNISRQIGWSNESNLLYQILKQLTKLTGVIFNLTPKYKVYTALLTQSGGDDAKTIDSGELTIGVTYLINQDNSGDFTNVGAPNNEAGTYFIATGTTPNSWGTNQLKYNTGAPVVKVLENTIGNIWFEFNDTGIYSCKSNDLFITDKTAIFGGYYYGSTLVNVYYDLPAMAPYKFLIFTGDPSPANGYLKNTPIEIRVYN